MSKREPAPTPDAVLLPAPRLRQAIRRSLLNWFARHRRDLPWRRYRGNAYAQWVAEIMLQQTQVETVIPYYRRFMQRFPNVRALADAGDQDVLQIWQGLGYYRRAMNLHRGAKLLAASGSDVPGTVEELILLPGVGSYTAGAIASMAFDRRTAAVDGNIARVLARLFCITDDITHPVTKRRLWTLARCLLPARRCGDFNQALMDLGAAVCTPVRPRCGVCPLKRVCAVRGTGDPSSLPRKPKRRKVPQRHHVVAVVSRKGKYLMERRPPGGLWGGLWEFPNTPCSPKADMFTTLKRLNEQLAIDPHRRGQAKGVICHRLTHRVMYFNVYLVDIPPGEGYTARRPGLRWVERAGLLGLPMSAACRKILALTRCRT